MTEPGQPAGVALRVDTTDPTPPYEQLRRQIADLVGGGLLRAGDRMPPLRQLAADLGLAVGTVARAYRELESSGLLVSRRGGGTRVAQGVGRSPAGARAGLREHAAAFARHARLLGIADDEALRAVGDALAAQPPGDALRPGPISHLG